MFFSNGPRAARDGGARAGGARARGLKTPDGACFLEERGAPLERRREAKVPIYSIHALLLRSTLFAAACAFAAAACAFAAEGARHCVARRRRHPPPAAAPPPAKTRTARRTQPLPSPQPRRTRRPFAPRRPRGCRPALAHWCPRWETLQCRREGGHVGGRRGRRRRRAARARRRPGRCAAPAPTYTHAHATAPPRCPAHLHRARVQPRKVCGGRRARVLVLQWHIAHARARRGARKGGLQRRHRGARQHPRSPSPPQPTARRRRQRARSRLRHRGREAAYGIAARHARVLYRKQRR